MTDGGFRNPFVNTFTCKRGKQQCKCTFEEPTNISEMWRNIGIAVMCLDQPLPFGLQKQGCKWIYKAALSKCGKDLHPFFHKKRKRMGEKKKKTWHINSLDVICLVPQLSSRVSFPSQWWVERVPAPSIFPWPLFLVPHISCNSSPIFVTYLQRSNCQLKFWGKVHFLVVDVAYLLKVSGLAIAFNIMTKRGGQRAMSQLLRELHWNCIF